MYMPNHVNASSAYWCATQCSRTGTKLSYKLQDFCLVQGFFCTRSRQTLLISSTVIHHAVKSTGKWEFIHATDRNFCFTSTEI